MTQTKYYAVGADGKIIGGGTDSRARANEWLADRANGVADLIVAESREEARRKYID